MPKPLSKFRFLPSSLRYPSAATFFLGLGLYAVIAAEPGRWAEMDYGPYLTASIEAPSPRTNIAYKGIAINLGANFGGDHNEAVVFDTDLLRYSCGWTGNFVALKGVVFDGEHWAYPRIDGSQLFGNPVAPGWAKAGSFQDPRDFHFGPLPRDWAHWRGLYLHEKKVVLSYSVGAMSVLEMPSLERAGDLSAFVRNFNLASDREQAEVQILSETNWVSEIVSLPLSQPPQTGAPASEGLVVLSPTAGSASNVLAVSCVGTTNAFWSTADGSVRLRFPAAHDSIHCKVFIWSGPRTRLREFAALVKATSPAPNLSGFTHGGPPRWPQSLVTQGQLGQNRGPYRLDTLTEPEPNPWHSWLRFGGIDFFPDGKRLAVCTWNGDVWLVSGVDENLKSLTWQRIATGLFQPLGLQIVNNDIYVLGRDQITRLRDLNGDGEVDFYENFNNDCMTSEHFHEFALDLKYGPDGNFYYIKCACHGVPASHPHHGTLMRVSHDGSKLEVVARGFRAANGLGVGPKGEFTCIDNQGYWMPGNRINWIQPGGWYGNGWAWNPNNRTNYDEPLCWMHNEVDRSGGTQLWVPTDQWGPFRDEVITISYGMGQMFLLLKEEVNGLMQGAVTRFPIEFDTGAMRGVFHPKTGQLYTCGLYGWAGNKTRPGAIYRVRYSGAPVHMPNELHFLRDGILLGFTSPLEPDSATDPGNYDVKAWNYHWTVNYGSPDFRLNGQEGRDTWTVQAAMLSSDHRRVFLKVPELQRVMQLNIAFHVRAADGTAVDNFVHGTIHNLGEKTGVECLGAGAIARADNASAKLSREASGLVQLLNSLQNPAQKDARVARLPALFVPAGAFPSSFLEAGGFRSHWVGFLKVPLNDRVTFELEGEGSATLKVGGQVVLDVSGGPLAGHTSKPVPLRQGYNSFELDYENPAKGDAVLRVAWASPRTPREPVPPTVFVHDAASLSLTQYTLPREGRRLWAEQRCVKCHAPDQPWSPGAMPELTADAPALDEIGERLQEPWLVQWLLDPKATRPEALMPKMLSGPSANADARDLAAFLATLRAPAAQSRKSALAMGPALAETGHKVYSDLGCQACHSLPGEMTLTNDTRISLAHIAEKWRPEALPEYLKSPAAHFEWTRMPDFKLSADEAGALSAFLRQLTRTNSIRLSSEKAVATPGNASRGGQLTASLGCLNCHSLQQGQNQFKAPSLTIVADGDWTKGCMADASSARGKAPDFSFSPEQRAALRALRDADLAFALAHDTPDDFSAREYTALRCQACHPRDTETDLLTQLTATQTHAESKEDDDFTRPATVHIGRPPLTFAGEKLYAGWVQRFLAGTLPYKPRPELQGRMPAYAAYAAGLAAGLAREHGYPAESNPSLHADPKLAAIGKDLTLVTGGFSCISCHNVGEQKALAGKDTATVNFACITERLRPSYYWRYVQDPPHLLQGTMMPKFIGEDGTTAIKTIFNGDPQKQFEAIWEYLISLNTPAR